MTAHTITSLPATTTVGPVTLKVANPERMTAFYRDVLGLTSLSATDRGAKLGTRDGRTLVQLEAIEQPHAPNRRSPGLFHQALLLPNRIELGRSLINLIQAGWRLSGAGDHLVSEALYLNDPEGNGIELYADRPEAEWTRSNGQVLMDTLPVDVDSIVREAQSDSRHWDGIATDVTMGHVHLKVSDLSAAEAFYHQLLGMDIMFAMPQALFLAAGGYHHHLGLNTWSSERALPADERATGLKHFAVNIPDQAVLSAILKRLQEAGVVTQETQDGIFTQDPSKNGVILRVAA